MNKKSIKSCISGAFSFLLVMLAAALGADSAFAMAVTITNEKAIDSKVEDSKGDLTQMPGVGASQSEAVESDFTPEEIDQAIAEFQAYQTPVEACISALAEKVSAESYEVIHYRTATPIFSVTTGSSKVTATGSGLDWEFTLTTPTNIAKKSARLLYECKTIYVPGTVGYDENGVANGMLACYVTLNDRASSTVKLHVLNPKSGVAPELPANATLLIGAVAASESQMIVAPDNFEPVPTKVYLQKRIFNIVMTQEWLNGKKKVKFAEEDMRKGALYSYKVNNEITDLLGVKSKFKVEVGNQMADEYVYTAEGILRQVNMYYALNGDIEATDLTAISQMQFTKFSANQEAQVFCGQDFIAGLLNMDLTVHKEIKFEDVPYEGLTVKGWKNNFGALNFIYTPVFDLIGMSKCALVVDLKNARNYVKRAAQTDTVDMKQGVGEIREAKRDIYSQIYAVALRGYNSMIVGPAEQMSSIGATLSRLTTAVTPVATSLDATGTAGVIYYLLKADASKGFEANTFVEWDGTKYVLYNGPVKA